MDFCKSYEQLLASCCSPPIPSLAASKGLTRVSHSACFGLNIRLFRRYCYLKGAQPFFTGNTRGAVAQHAVDKILDLGHDDLLRIAGAKAGLDHGGGIDVDLDGRFAAAENIALEVRRDVDDERVSAGVHERHNISLRDRLRRLEVGRQERVNDAPRQFGLVFIDKCDGGVVQFLRITLRLRDDGKRECVDYQSQQHEIADEAADFLGA